jgi:hypothetical protein
MIKEIKNSLSDGNQRQTFELTAEQCHLRWRSNKQISGDKWIRK